MAARSGIPRKYQRVRFALRSSCVEVVEVVQEPQRVETGDATVRSLLPVDPPEILALLFQLAMQHI